MLPALQRSTNPHFQARYTKDQHIATSRALVRSNRIINPDFEPKNGEFQVGWHGFPPNPTESFANGENPRFEYVRAFEQPDILLPNTWIVVRLDGRGFTKYELPSPLRLW